MALTDRKRKFVAALQSGLSGAKAAIAAGYSEKGATQAASRLRKDPDVLAALERKECVEQAKTEAKEHGRPLNVRKLAEQFDDPKEFLTAMMNDAAEDPKLRLDAAKTLMPYVHSRKGEGGKKDERKQVATAAAASGRLAPKAPPKLVVNNA